MNVNKKLETVFGTYLLTINTPTDNELITMYNKGDLNKFPGVLRQLDRDHIGNQYFKPISYAKNIMLVMFILLHGVDYDNSNGGNQSV